MARICAAQRTGDAMRVAHRPTRTTKPTTPRHIRRVVNPMVAFSAGCVLTLSATGTTAQEAPAAPPLTPVPTGTVTPTTSGSEAPQNSGFYFSMGGGELVLDALNTKAVGFSIGLNPDFKMPTSCDIWTNRENLPDYIKSVVRDYVGFTMDDDGLTAAVVLAVTTLGEMAVVSILERALPGMYDWMTNLKGQIDAALRVGRRSCQEAVDRMRDGSNPFDAWLDISAAVAWRKTLVEEPGVDYAGDSLVKVARDMPERAADENIPWFGEEAGGDPGKPIEVVKGIVSAGYAAISSTATTGVRYAGAELTGPANNDVLRLGAVDADPVPRPSRLSKLWPTSTDAVTFATQVLGEESITYCTDPGCDSELTPGVGLKPIFAQERDAVTAAWRELLEEYDDPAGPQPKIAELNDVSGNATRITYDLYQALWEMNPQDRNVSIYKLISDVAVERTLEKGLALRQILQSGLMAPDVQSYGHTREKGERFVAAARQAVEDLMWEVDLSKKAASTTASTILEAAAIARSTRTGEVLSNGASTTTNEMRGGEIIERSGGVGTPPTISGPPPELEE